MCYSLAIAARYDGLISAITAALSPLLFAIVDPQMGRFPFLPFIKNNLINFIASFGYQFIFLLHLAKVCYNVPVPLYKIILMPKSNEK